MKLLVKVLGSAASIGAGLIGTKLISLIWKGATGEVPPTPTNPEAQQRATIGKVLVFAVISGASAATIQALTRRWTQKLIEKEHVS